MKRILSRSTQTAIDLSVLSLAIWLAFLVRFEWAVPLEMLKRLLVTWPYVVGFQYLVLMGWGVHRFVWRYVGLREAMRIVFAVATATAALLVMRFVLGRFVPTTGAATYAVIPTGVILIDSVLALLGVGGIRALRRWLGEKAESERVRPSAAKAVPTLLIGAGQAGLLIAKEIEARRDLGIEPVGFLDDDRMKVGSVLHGIPVLGLTSELAGVKRRTGARQALITIAAAPGPVIRRITQACEEAKLPVKIIPGIYEIVGERVNLSRIRDVTIEDLLGREPVELETEAIAETARGQTVLVTGAGGSIGSELCRQLCHFGPGKLVLVDQAENGLFFLERELRAAHPEVPLVPCIADIADVARIDTVFTQHAPRLVFHAAAHKHVPMMEANPGEAIKNNVFGTKALADCADAHGVGTFVMISTDKAVNPTSIMGVSKRVAEIYIQALSQRSRTKYVTVRFGNVLGSAGSVIPIFKEQIAKGGPVTVTHPEMKRYFMTIPEASQLVLQAASMGAGGEIFILDMGEPVKIVDLARDLIALSGLRPGHDIEVAFTGMRPGEKLFEELSVDEEKVEKTKHPKIFIGRIRPHDWSELGRALSELRKYIDCTDRRSVAVQFKRIVPEFHLDGAPALLPTPLGTIEQQSEAPVVTAKAS